VHLFELAKASCNIPLSTWFGSRRLRRLRWLLGNRMWLTLVLTDFVRGRQAANQIAGD
jgi:hypothetical protein